MPLTLRIPLRLGLRFSSTTVRITGQNLDAEVRPNFRLLSGILRNRVPWIQENWQLGCGGQTHSRPTFDRIASE